MRDYNVEYDRLARLLLPVTLRRKRLMAFVGVMTSEVWRISGWFRRYRDDTDYRLSHNGQVCYLRAVLNDKFDPVLRRITIEDIGILPETIIHRRSTGLFLLLKHRPEDIILHRRGFGGYNSYDFTVVLPAALRASVNEARLHAVINTYRLAGKRYTLSYR